MTDGHQQQKTPYYVRYGYGTVPGRLVLVTVALHPQHPAANSVVAQSLPAAAILPVHSHVRATSTPAGFTLIRAASAEAEG
jgi:hypothetical protein